MSQKPVKFSSEEQGGSSKNKIVWILIGVIVVVIVVIALILILKKGDDMGFEPPIIDGVVCENNQGYQVVNINGSEGNYLSYDSWNKFEESDFDIAEISDLNCLEYLAFSDVEIINSGELVKLTNLKTLNLVFSNVPEDECNNLKTVLINTEVRCPNEPPPTVE